MNAERIKLNGVTYRWPSRPVVVVCIDGGDPAYIEQGLKDGIIPYIERFMKDGFSAIADGVVPSFTNPNNMSIVCGGPPSAHGISGNFFLDPESGAEVMMNDPKFLRSSSVLAEFSRNGAKVVAITAKDKLRKQLGKGLDMAEGSINFSSEKADRCTLAENGVENVLELVGMPLPDVYSAELSLFVLEA
ncbi:MAG: alkaline phosphatase family protein, partial [Alphaproteobacteria bacterium]